ncbi:hypothetical protein ATE48_07740 [Candidatus Viadribacter manganicus]|uniref:Uncharacterized protein n=1 Tax=Candidatus Viadribacter manganicus TaxID=1759059 RepID=A0A1B1AGY9_9PROT|nr:hypothetical protein ATE48_07740 [Candidatus Viadribacter manganicus]
MQPSALHQFKRTTGAKLAKRVYQVAIAQTIGEVDSSFDPHHRSRAASLTKLLSEGHVPKQLSRVGGKWLRRVLASAVS